MKFQHSRFALAVLACAFMVWGMAFARDTKQFDPAITADVIVNAVSGTVKGTLVSYDPEGLTIQPASKPPTASKRRGAVPPPDDSEPATAPSPVTIKWADVRTVSNGLTQRKALEAWQSEHRNNLCPTCHGERQAFCTVCKGTGHDPAALKGCKTCKDELLIDCKSPGCKDGQIPCPNGCLQLGVGHWTKHPDGSQWYSFPWAGGTQYFSEHHLGHLIFVDRKTTTVRDDGVCPVCGGTTRTIDPVCLGSGKMPCPTCSARKTTPACPNNCDHGRVPCPDCNGTGLKKA